MDDGKTLAQLVRKYAAEKNNPFDFDFNIGTNLENIARQLVKKAAAGDIRAVLKVAEILKEDVEAEPEAKPAPDCLDNAVSANPDKRTDGKNNGGTEIRPEPQG